MNLSEAINSLEKKGYKVYDKGNYYLLYLNGKEWGQYSTRTLIRFARNGGHQSMGHRSEGKCKPGPGGINCPCCLPAFGLDFKRKTAQRNRRKNNQSNKQYEES